MTTAQRLTALDAGFLRLESAVTPMHTGSIAVFEGRPLRDTRGRIRLDDIRRLVEERLDLVPRFRQRVVEAPMELGRPTWVDDPDFDVSHHVKLCTLPPPGSDEQLRRLAESLHTELLDRSRPLWELWYVEGLARGRVGVIQKVHHAVMDGVSGVDVATALMDPTRTVRRMGGERWAPTPGPSAVATLAGEALLPLATTAAVARWGAGALLRPFEGAARIRRTVGGLTSFADGGLLAPRTSINQRIGRRRRLEVVHLPMSEVDRIRHILGGTVNDVVLTAVTGGLARLLDERGEVPERAPRALVPVSLRGGPGDVLTLGNRVAGMFVPLPVQATDELSRLEAVRAAVAERKARSQPAAMAAVLGTTERLPMPLASAVTGLLHHQPFVNVVVTNVPGPRAPLYVLGARMLDAVPIVPLSANLDFSVGILSYMAQVAIGIFGDPDRCPDLAVMAEGIDKSFAALGYVADEHT